MVTRKEYLSDEIRCGCIFASFPAIHHHVVLTDVIGCTEDACNFWHLGNPISYVTGWLGRLLSHFPVEVFHVSEALHGSFAKLTPVVQRANGSSQPRGGEGGQKGSFDRRPAREKRWRFAIFLSFLFLFSGSVF